MFAGRPDSVRDPVRFLLVLVVWRANCKSALTFDRSRGFAL